MSRRKRKEWAKRQEQQEISTPAIPAFDQSDQAIRQQAHRLKLKNGSKKPLSLWIDQEAHEKLKRLKYSRRMTFSELVEFWVKNEVLE